MPTSPALLRHLKELRELRNDADRLAASKLRNAIARLTGCPAAYERIASSSPRDGTLRTLTTELAEAYRDLFDSRIQSITDVLPEGLQP